MSEPSAVSTTDALAAVVAAATTALSGQAETASLVSPFPTLDSDHEAEDRLGRTRADDIGTAAAAALSSAITNAQMPAMDGGAQALALATQQQAMLAAPVMTSTQDEDVLASLHRSAQDQVLEIMGAYHSTNAHRRRSSVEAVAAASSVLASFASGAKPYMSGDVAAAMGAYSTQAQHSAAAALLAASGMHNVMLPTIPSVSASLQGTPALSAAIDEDTLLSTASSAALAAAVARSAPVETSGLVGPAPVSDSAAMHQVLGMAAFGSLSPTSISAATQITSEMAAASIDVAPSLRTPQPHRSLSAESTPRHKKGATGARRRKLSRSTASELPDPDLSTDDDERLIDAADSGMPLTPDAPGSGRPGSLRHLTPDERRARRLQRNRMAAKECRQKKKAYIQNLEDQMLDLRDENARLRKEIEELNAKLTLGAMRASSSATTPVLDPRPPLSADYAPDSSIESLSSPSLTSKRPRVSVRSTTSARLTNADY
ncbi:hypothetical protein LPJ72_004102 [Coemansia sp. Benny D160-2]|nr:hypothetical protein LPJ72_004102 [Coemansia sp. Benny D160-2]